MTPKNAIGAALRSIYIRAGLVEERLRSGVAWWPLARDFVADPYPAYRRLRELDPVHYSILTRQVVSCPASPTWTASFTPRSVAPFGREAGGFHPSHRTRPCRQGGRGRRVRPDESLRGAASHDRDRKDDRRPREGPRPLQGVVEPPGARAGTHSPTGRTGARLPERPATRGVLHGDHRAASPRAPRRSRFTAGGSRGTWGIAVGSGSSGAGRGTRKWEVPGCEVPTSPRVLGPPRVGFGGSCRKRSTCPGDHAGVTVNGAADTGKPSSS